MPLVNSKEMFEKAYQGGYAVGAFNVNNMEIVQAITEAAAPTLTDAQKVESALAACTLAANTTADITLPVVEGVAWSLKAASDYAVIENGVLKVTRPEHATGNVKVVVVATATFGAESDSKEIEVEIVEKEDSGIKEVTELDPAKTYKLGLYHNTNAKYLFATGAMNGFYGELVEDAAAAADVKVIAVTGGYQLLVGTKYLILVQEYKAEQNKTFTNVIFSAEATDFVWAYNAEHNTFTHAFEDATYYVGTYGTFTTLSSSKLDKIGTSFPAHLYEVKAQDGGNEEQPPVQTGDAIVSYEIANKAIPAGLTYISNNPASYPNPSFYADGGLKMNFVNIGVQTAAFEAQSKVVVTLTINALNDNTKTDGGKDAFTVYGLDANGNVVMPLGKQDTYIYELLKNQSNWYLPNPIY